MRLPQFMGREVIIDPSTLTMTERKKARRVLAEMDVEPDELDMTVATVWVVMTRDEPDLTFDEVCDNMTAGILESAEVGEDDDSPEA